MFDVNEVRRDFPLFGASENEGLIYLDSAATAQRPACVLEAVAGFYRRDNANPLRGLYGLSVRATECYEASRRVVARFLGAADPSCVIFTRNATESLNLVAYTLGLEQLHEGDEIALTCMEHHSNILPWQMVAERTGAKLVWLECNEEGTIPQSEIEEKITARTKLAAVVHMSNVFGVVNPVRRIADRAHQVGDEGKGAIVVVDGAQSAAHMKIDVEALGADFFALSAHKLGGPMGIGALWGRRDLLERMSPFLRGGEMIDSVSREGATFAALPHKFEAGTVNAGGAVGFARAVEYIEDVGLEAIARHDEEISAVLVEGMKRIPHVNIVGSQDGRAHHGIVSFTVDGVHPHDIASILDTEGVAIRAGHHCAEPLMQKLGVGSTARASSYFYNTVDEAELFIDKLSHVRQWMGLKD